MMASTKVLGIVELVHAVLYALENRADVSRCARVNRLWAQEALPLLWRESPPIKVMLDLARKSDLKKYIGYILSLIHI